jgi:hypothetical protein
MPLRRLPVDQLDMDAVVLHGGSKNVLCDRVEIGLALQE